MNKVEHKLYAAILYLAIYLLITVFYENLRVSFWPSIFMVILGSHFPDFDLDFGIQYHRSPITHAPWIPAAFFVFYLATPNPAWVVETMAWFIFGYGIHLIFDVAPSGWGVIGLFLSSFTPERTPGDVRGVSEPLERPFLLLGGTVCLLMSLTLFLLTRGIIILPWLPISQGISLP